MRPVMMHWLVMTVALGLTAYLIPGIAVTSFGALIVAALVLGFLNAVLRPILVLLTLPVTIMTLGFFYLVVNAIVFALAAVLVPGFVVAGFGPALIGAILVSLVSWFLGSAMKPRSQDRRVPR